MSIKTHLLQHLSWKRDKNSFGGDVSFRRLFSKRALSLGFVTFHYSFLLFIPFTSSAAGADCPGGAATLQSLLLVVTLLCPWWVGWEGIFHFIPQGPCSPPDPLDGCFQELWLIFEQTISGTGMHEGTCRDSKWAQDKEGKRQQTSNLMQYIRINSSPQQVGSPGKETHFWREKKGVPAIPVGIVNFIGALKQNSNYIVWEPTAP